MKPQLPIRFHTLEDLAQEWGYTTDALLSMAHDGLLQIDTALLNGVMRTVIHADERARIEAMYGQAKGDKGEHPGKVKSALFLLAAGMAVWSGEDADLMAHPYNMRDFLESDFASKGIAMLRTRETDAELIREAFAVLAESGLYKTPEQRQREEVINRAIASNAGGNAKAA